MWYQKCVLPFEKFELVEFLMCVDDDYFNNGIHIPKNDIIASLMTPLFCFIVNNL